ncbi:MAG: heme o synthase [Gemmatimonadetes bacterium]|nr:heme o synthase [Gemmatimonadota bacterium]
MDSAITSTRAEGSALVRAYYELTKPGIAGYVMITAGVSAYVASRGHIELGLAIHTMLGTGLATAGALALNQWVERDYDARMMRTRNRPIPSGRLASTNAWIFGTVLMMAGIVYLALLVGTLPAGLAALSAAAYHGVYTPLKTRSSLATLAGGVPGALPTLIGWSAATGSLSRAGLALFALAYAWQIPHVLGLAWMLRRDYERVGFKLIPPHDSAGKVVGRHMVAWTTVLVPLSTLPWALGYTGTMYLVGALFASGAFLSLGMGAARHLTERAARKVFFGSLIYHPVLLVLMLVNTLRP